MYAAATVQGVALVTFPAASTIFTSPSYYGLSSTAYGAMFLPQAVTAIAASLLGARLTRSWGIKRVFHAGSDRKSRLDAPAAAQPGSDGQSVAGVRHPAAGDDLSGHRLWTDGAVTQHLRRRFLPDRRSSAPC